VQAGENAQGVRSVLGSGFFQKKIKKMIFPEIVKKLSKIISQDF
jgi:hypothetical protein